MLVSEYHNIRIMPSLLLHGNAGMAGLYKTTKFKKPSYIGDAINAVKIFNDKGADELILLDISARKLGHPPQFDVIEEIASEAFMPIAYGGGIDNTEQAEKIINLGVEKIILTQNLWQEYGLCRAISDKIGAQSVVVCVNIKRNIWGQYGVYDYIKEKIINIDIKEYIAKLIEAGAGEIMLQNIDRDGTMQGFDFTIFEKYGQGLTIPVIMAGGCRDTGDITTAAQMGIKAVAVGAKFVYMGIHRAVMINYPTAQELDNIQQVFKR